MPSSQPDQTGGHLQPRRRPLKYCLPSLVDSSPYDVQDTPPSKSSPNVHLKKGETFHSPTSPPSQDHDPVLDIRSLPRRSPTCPRTLEDIAAREESMADILNRLTLDDVPAPEDSHDAKDDLPVPEAIRRAHASRSTAKGAPDSMKNSRKPDSPAPKDNSPRKTKNHAHCSDSGIGTSISSRRQHSVSSGSESKGKIVLSRIIMSLTLFFCCSFSERGTIVLLRWGHAVCPYEFHIRDSICQLGQAAVALRGLQAH